MSFDKDLKLALDDIDIPEELMPKNIEAMLMRVGKQDCNKETSENIDRSVKITAKRSNRSNIMRTIAAAAACVALAGGFLAMREQTAQPVEIESEIEYEAVQVQTYDELYNIYTGIYLNNSGENSADSGNGDGVEILTDETAITEITSATVTDTEPAITEAEAGEEKNVPADEPKAVRSDFSDADIVKSDDSSIYYICDGTLYVVSKDNMAVTAEIVNENSPFEMFIRGNSLVLVSEETVSDALSEDSAGGTDVVVDIYDISAETPVRITTYKQNGEYISARIDDAAVLYLVTGYSDYRAAPLDETANLENYVPGYYIDGQKHYVAAEDITVPSGANNTDYTVISAVKCAAPSEISVKAVLGSSADSYCSEDTLYVTCKGYKDNKAYTAITAFAITESSLSFKGAGTVNGELISRYSMAENDGVFRIACRDYDENGMINTNIYTLDSSMTVISTADHLLPGVIVGSVKYDGNFASIIERGAAEPALVVDLAQSAPVENAAEKGFMASYVNKLDENHIAGLTACADENHTRTSLRLELYNADSGVKISETVFAEYADVDSPALTDKMAMLVDADNRIIGIPVSSVNEFGVKNQYYVFSWDETGLIQKGVIEYNDIDDSYKFERAVVTDGVLYIIGSGRMVSVVLADMTVVESFDFQ